MRKREREKEGKKAREKDLGAVAGGVTPAVDRIHLGPASLVHVRLSMPNSGLGFQAKVRKTFGGVPASLIIGYGVIDSWLGYHESRRCSRDTYPESYITKCASIQRKLKPWGGSRRRPTCGGWRPARLRCLRGPVCVFTCNSKN